ncbi:MAG: hypothetical protein IKO33_05490 [Bacteroidaceae bacterium]|nr:hypothetical protein [Bacteroidaceae bacterium]
MCKLTTLFSFPQQDGLKIQSSANSAYKTAEDSGGEKGPAQGDFFSCPEKNIFLPRKKFFQALKKKGPK